MAQTLTVKFLGDTRDLDRAFGKVHDGATGIGKHLGLAAKIGAAAVGVGLAGAMKVFGDEAIQSQKVSAQTAAVIKSTGGAANVTAQQVDSLAQSLLNKSGVDDETIKSGENVLMTFTNIRNEAGKGNDIFNQATKSALDLSVALGQDMQTSAIQLGKALNDPVKGMGALQRVGVSFTEEQKDQVKAMVAAGDQMGAQKLILGELTKEFGGSAEAAGKTFGGQMNIAKESIKNSGAQIVTGLMPAIAKFTEGVAVLVPKITEWGSEISARLQPTLARLAAWFQENWPQIKATLVSFVEWFKANLLPIFAQLAHTVGEAVGAIVKVLKDNGPALRQIWEAVKTLLHGIGEVMQTVILPVLRIILVDLLPKVLTALIKTIAGVITVVEKLADAFKAVAGWLGKVIDGIQWLIDNAGKIGGIFGKVGGVVGHIPGFASGGIVTGPTLAMVGEAGPEAIIPLSKMGGMGGGIVVNVNGAVGAPDQIADMIYRELVRRKQRGQLSGGLGLA